MININRFSAADDEAIETPYPILTASNPDGGKPIVYLNTKARALFPKPKGDETQYIFLGVSYIPNDDDDKEYTVIGLMPNDTEDFSKPILTAKGKYKPAVYFNNTGSFYSKSMVDVCKQIAVDKYKRIGLDIKLGDIGSVTFSVDKISNGVCSISLLGFKHKEDSNNDLREIKYETLKGEYNFIYNYYIVEESNSIAHPHLFKVGADTSLQEIDSFIESCDLYGKNIIVSDTLRNLNIIKQEGEKTESTVEDLGIDYSEPQLPNVEAKYTKTNQ